MNSDSRRPRRSGKAPAFSSLAYCRRLPCRACKALTTGVNTNDRKLCAMVLPPHAAGRLGYRPAALWVLSAARCVLQEQRLDAARDLFAVRFEREMTRVQQMRLDVRQVAAVCGGPFRREDDVVLAPHDQRLHPIGTPQRQAVANRRAIVHHVERERAEAELLDQRFYNVGQILEGVGKVPAIRHTALAEAGIVRGYDVK